MLAPSVPQVLETFRPDGSGRALGSFCVTVYIMGFCFGPLILAPLTDSYGRKAVYRVSSLFFAVLTIACALSPSLESLIAFRFLAGCFGGAPMAIGGAVIADMYPLGQRGTPMAFYSAGTMMGPTIGPVVGGAVSGSLGWRWVFWVASILVCMLSLPHSTRSPPADLIYAAIAFLALTLILPETHLPTLIRHYNQEPQSWKRLWSKGGQDAVSTTSILAKTTLLPARIAFFPPCSAILALMVIFNGLVNMILSSLGSVYQYRFAFPLTTAGLAYLGIGFGGIMALTTAKRLTIYLSRCLSDADTHRPEHILPSLWFTLPLGGVGLLWYGWAVQSRSHWIVPILGLVPFGYGYMSVRVSSVWNTQSVLSSAFR